MPDICDLILDDHERQRRRFAELDEVRNDGPAALERVWGPLSAFLELHAAAEEATFYPTLVKEGEEGDDETEDAISDHNKIRDAVRAASEAEVGSDSWWKAVNEARGQNSDHMGEEERGALADLRANTAREQRLEMGQAFQAFETGHAGGRNLTPRDKDPDAYVEQHG